MDPQVEYKKVKDFSDLLQTNLDFFNGKMPETYYYGTSWGKGECQNNDAEVATKNLIELTKKHRIFTTNGQSNYYDKNTDQRSYLVCYMEKQTYNYVYKNLLDDPRIWAVFILTEDHKILNLCSFVNYSEISSLLPNQKRIILTLECKNPYRIWTRGLEAREEYETTKFVNINSILKDTVYCIIICKEWNKGPTADSIILEHL